MNAMFAVAGMAGCRVRPWYVWTGVMKFVCGVCALTVRERNRHNNSSIIVTLLSQGWEHVAAHIEDIVL